MGALTLSSNSDGGGWVSACARVCARAYVHACVMCLQYTIILFDPG